MRVGFFTSLVLIATCLCGSAAADVIVTLDATDVGGLPITGAVAPGSQVFVDVLLSVDGADDPLADVRLIQLDFGATSPTIAISQFTWMLEPGISDASYLLLSDLPVVTATYFGFEGIAGLIINLDGTPQRVATLTVTVNDVGTLDAGATGATGTTLGIQIQADFIAPTPFTSENANLRGDALAFQVTAQDDTDSDGDGVPDALDAFPDDPDETVDTDGDGTGDNSDAFPTDPDETTDTDGDGIGDNLDIDDDGDGTPDTEDDLPLDPSETVDTDGDGIGDNLDTDDDGDGTPDVDDPDPLDPSVTGDGPSDSDNTGPRASGGLCGFGMLGASIAIFMSLSATRLHRGRRTAAGAKR